MRLCCLQAGVVAAQNLLASTELFRLQYSLAEDDGLANCFLAVGADSPTRIDIATDAPGTEFQYETWNTIVHIGLILWNLASNGGFCVDCPLAWTR